MTRLLSVTALLLASPLGPASGQSVESHDRESLGAAARPTGGGDTPDLKKVAAGVTERTNAFRKEQGRGPVGVNKELAAAAEYFAGYMAETGKYGHTADGSRPSDRAKKHGYDYCIVAENIAYVFNPNGFTAEALADEFFTGWKNSPPHRKNMLDPDVTDTAVAVARSKETGYYYAVQMFGRPKSAAIEFKIENRAGDEVSYSIGDKTYTLPPRYTRTHEQCRPAEVSFQWPGEKKPSATVKPAAGDAYVISKEGGTYRVTKQKGK